MGCVGAKLQTIEWSEHTSSASSVLSSFGAKTPEWGEGNTHCKGQSQLKPDPQGFYSSKLGAALPLTGWGEPLSREDTVPHGWLQPQPLHLQPHSLTNTAHPEQRRGGRPHQTQLSQKRHRAHGGRTGTLPHRKTSSKPKQVTALSRFTEKGKARQNEKAEELLSIERAKEQTPEK